MTVPRLPVPALLLLALAGCSSLQGTAPPPAAAPRAVVRHSEEGGKFITLVGPKRQFAAPIKGVTGTKFTVLPTRIDTRSAQRLTQLYVEYSYVGDPRDFAAAHDADGTALKFIPISRNEIACDNGSCSYAAEFAANLPEPLLRAKHGGMTVVFTAKSGPDLTISVPGDLIEEQLAALDEAAATLPAAAAAPAAGPSH